MSEERSDQVMSRIIGAAYPVPELIGEGDRRLIRRWIVRSERVLASQAALDEMTPGLVARVVEITREAYKDHASADRLLSSEPAVEIVRVDSTHCIVCIESVAPSHAIGNEVGIATWGVLRQLDALIEIADLQGIPKHFWFPMRV